MADPKSRARVERLLDSKNRTEDLVHLFLYARDRCDGRESVQEIGDFVAHHSERSKGIVTRSVRDFFSITKFFGPLFGPGGPYDVDPQDLPNVTPDFLKACFRNLDNSIIKSKAGMSKTRAYPVLQSLVHALHKKSDGRFCLPKATKAEIDLFQCLTTHIAPKPAFDGFKLFEDFCATLKSNGLITKEELRKASAFRPSVLLFAVSIMHNSTIQIEDGSKIRLCAHPDANGLGVGAAVPVRNIGQANAVSFGSDIFKADVAADEFCSRSLIEIADWSSVEVELGSDGKLAIL